jgi:hypothetical protein
MTDIDILRAIRADVAQMRADMAATSPPLSDIPMIIQTLAEIQEDVRATRAVLERRKQGGR